MTLRSRLLLTTAALSFALGAGGFAAAQNRMHQPMQNGAMQNSAPHQDENQAQAPNAERSQNGNHAGAANGSEAQTGQGQGSNNDETQSSNSNGRMNNNERSENNTRSNENAGNKGAQAPSSGNAASNKGPAGSNQNAERGTRRNENAADRGGERNENAAQRGGERNENAAERGAERNENAAQRGDERNGNAAGRGGERNENAANPAPNRTGNAEQREGSSRVSTRLSSAEKTRLNSAIGKINIRPATNVNFSVAVGTTVPRSVVLHPLPADVVAIVPQYRGFDFFVVRDEVVIVEPDNHRIVDVIERTGGARTAETTRSRKLHLSERDRTYIRKHYTTRRTVIDRAGPPRESHTVIGEDVPESVTVERFPREVYRHVPSIRSYGYVHEGRDLYLVEPGTRHVIESIGPDED